MPRFFFDTDDGEFHHHDRDGQDLLDMKAARIAGLDALPDMARDKMPDGDCHTFSVRVRDETDVVVYAATLDLRGAWTLTPPA